MYACIHACVCVCVHVRVCVCTETMVRREIKIDRKLEITDGRIIIAKDVKILDYIVSH